MEKVGRREGAREGEGREERRREGGRDRVREEGRKRGTEEGKDQCQSPILRIQTSLMFISKNQPGVQRSDSLKSSPGSHSPLVNSDSVGITSSCSLLVSALSVSLASSCLRCLCFTVSTSIL